MMVWILFFIKTEGGEIKSLSDYPCLLMFIELWPVELGKHLERMSIRVDEDNGRDMVIIRMMKVCQFSCN